VASKGGSIGGVNSSENNGKRKANNGVMAAAKNQ